MKLTDAQIRRGKPADKPYKLADGRGLTLVVEPHGSKLWRFRYRFHDKESMLSLGCYPDVTLNDARNLLVEARRTLATGERPLSKGTAVAKAIGKLFGDLVAEKLREELATASNGTARNKKRQADHPIAELGAVPIDKIDGTTMAKASVS